jgi:hypothetical protein
VGTRNLTCVVMNGEFKIAQYGQWDGYLRGQGKTVLDFIRRWDEDKFRKALSKLAWLTDEEGKEIDKDENWPKTYPHLSRDAGATILSMVQNGKAKKLNDQKDFAKDHTFCEYAYLLDMDKRVLEIYCHGRGKGLLGKMLGAGTIPMWKRLTFEEAAEPGMLQKLMRAGKED